MPRKPYGILLSLVGACGGGAEVAESKATHPDLDAESADAAWSSDGYLDTKEAASPSIDGSLRDNAADADEACDPPPPFPPDGPCAQLGFTAVANSYELWITDPSAPQGGWRITLALNETQTVGGHIYTNHGAGLTGGGGNGVYGDALFDVDGQLNQLHFHFEGCVVPTGEETWDAEMAVTRTNLSCVDCQPSTTGRHYTIVHTGSGRGTYTFLADEPPRGCGAGMDLLKVVLPG